jgi:hypothetical protein
MGLRDKFTQGAPPSESLTESIDRRTRERPCPGEWCESGGEPQRVFVIIGCGSEASKAGGVVAAPAGSPAATMAMEPSER